ncbi:hypothetical protein KDK95_06110 [Actinospica sp. MGRD01-02]|uniref:BACON domain-containing protein n=1 Tax=Actinospica acidithermotolerans TaxID=2828514 RepID=A0A941E685_9ACTN|nr:hypothetical protein [Actinospica acidithermotolerans]MBR7825876.1 hypothetical protein [Actinospica acidithermotolerans]
MNAESSGGGHAVAGAVLGGTAGDGWGRAAAYDAYADGLHTYSLWYLHDHDAAADAVYCAFVAADRNHTNLQQPEQIQPWLYALLRRECRLRGKEGASAPAPASRRLRPKSDSLGESGVTASLLQLEGNLRRAEFQSLAWPEAEGLAPSHREVLELTIRHGLDSRGLALVLGLREAAGLAPAHGFGLLADAWRELERSLAAAAVAGSGRDNCAQLAELTFGWSGKLNGTLRAPLIDHVDRCSRCQHYLHTVIGTPSAPTILPFVAAPRALRDMLLAELADADAAAAAGVDLVALGRRCGKFGPEGFPGRLETSAQAPTSGNGNGTGSSPGSGTSGSGGSSGGGSGAVSAGTGRVPRRRQPGPSGRAAAHHQRPQSAKAGTAQATSAKTGMPPRPPAPPHQQQPSPQSAQRPPQRQQSQPLPLLEPDDSLYRAKGSWADKVLPPAPGSDVFGAAEPWRPPPGQTFVQTASGRFATRPAQPGSTWREARISCGESLRPAGYTAESSTAASRATSAAASAATRPPSAAPAAPKPTDPAVKSGAAARPRHKARPMRQAVVSAMALGAIGAVAATAAAMLGIGSSPNPNTSALDGSQGTENVGTSSTSSSAAADSPGHLTVSVTTASTASSGQVSGATSVGLPGSGGTAVASTTAASVGAFHVSVNQRDADPQSVQILLRNTGSAALNWTAAPSVSWLTLSQSSGTLAPGQSLIVTATTTDAAPSGEWTAQIVFGPGGIVVTLHGGVPASSASSTDSGTGASTGGGASAGTSTSPTTPTKAPTSPTTPAPTTSSPTTSSPSSPASATGSQSGATGAGDTASGSQAPTSSQPTGANSSASSTAPSQPVRRH